MPSARLEFGRQAALDFLLGYAKVILGMNDEVRSMKRISIKLPDEIMALAVSEEDMTEAIRRLFVLDLVRRKMISAGKGAEVLGINLADFAKMMSEHGIPYYDYTPEEAKREFKAAKETLLKIKKTEK